MTRITTNKYNKTEWPEGKWKHEPDVIEWEDEETGYPCLIVRHPRIGHLCGYVAVPKKHPCFGLDDSDKRLHEIAVHGGVTFTGERIKYSPIKNVWWIGFDCAHLDDACPTTDDFDMKTGLFKDGTYKDMNYVTKECGDLAKQLNKIVRRLGSVSLVLAGFIITALYVLNGGETWIKSIL